MTIQRDARSAEPEGLVSGVFHEKALGDRFQRDTHARADGPAPDHQTYGSFATFSDPDGNSWLLQEVTARLPGR